MDTKSTGKYLKYAIGEIVLVVVGILIALQINNWNSESQKEAREEAYLAGIMHDLENDLEFMKWLLPNYLEKLDRYNRFDTLIQLKSDSLFDARYGEIRALIYQMPTFYPIVGSYASLISENSTELISDKSLSKLLKNIYEIEYVRISSLGQELDDISTKITWERRKEIRRKFFGSEFEDYDALFDDLQPYQLMKWKFKQRLMELMVQVAEAIDEIKANLNESNRLDLIGERPGYFPEENIDIETRHLEQLEGKYRVVKVENYPITDIDVRSTIFVLKIKQNYISLRNEGSRKWNRFYLNDEDEFRSSIWFLLDDKSRIITETIQLKRDPSGQVSGFVLKDPRWSAEAIKID